MQQGQQELHRRSLNLRELIRRITHLLCNGITESRVHISDRMMWSLVDVRVDNRILFCVDAKVLLEL